MPVLRWLRSARTGRWVGARLGAGYIRLVTVTTRWDVVGRGHLDALLARGGGFIPSIWHGRLFMSPTFAPPGRHTVAMISQNRDGALIAAIVARFDVAAVRGSTYDHAKGRDKGGGEAFSGARSAILTRDAVVAITPDGPRGPRMRAQPGVAALSIATGAPVLPVAFSVRRGVNLRSWDRFLMPLPLGRGVIIYGPPLMPPGPEASEAAVEAHRLAIEAATTAVTDQADDLCGRPRVAPGA